MPRSTTASLMASVSVDFSAARPSQMKKRLIARKKPMAPSRLRLLPGTLPAAAAGRLLLLERPGAARRRRPGRGGEALHQGAKGRGVERTHGSRRMGGFFAEDEQASLDPPGGRPGGSSVRPLVEAVHDRGERGVRDDVLR